MPQTDTFLSESDLESIVGFLLDRGCWLIPDLLFEQSPPGEIRTLAEFRLIRTNQRAKLFFVLNRRWQKGPLEMKSISKGGVEKFYVQQRSGGPTLDVFAPPLLTRSDGNILPHGFVGYNRTFWNALENENQVPSSGLHEFYKSVINLLRMESEIRSLTSRKYLLAKGARRLVNEGVKLGAPFLST